MFAVGLKDSFSLSLVIVVQRVKARLKTEPLEMSEALGVMGHWTLFFYVFNAIKKRKVNKEGNREQKTR